MMVVFTTRSSAVGEVFAWWNLKFSSFMNFDVIVKTCVSFFTTVKIEWYADKI